MYFKRCVQIRVDRLMWQSYSLEEEEFPSNDVDSKNEKLELFGSKFLTRRNDLQGGVQFTEFSLLQQLNEVQITE